eukprot:5937896-Pleurochrysis_carterae.AAC.4
MQHNCRYLQRSYWEEDENFTPQVIAPYFRKESQANDQRSKARYDNDDLPRPDAGGAAAPRRPGSPVCGRRCGGAPSTELCTLGSGSVIALSAFDLTTWL